MIGNTLEGTRKGEPVLIVAVYASGQAPKVLCIGLDSKLHLYPLEEVSVNWHYDETEGWVSDFPRPNS